MVTKAPGGPCRVLVCIPTYNERENLVPIVERVQAVSATLSVLVIDDASPDGTGEIADRLARSQRNVFVLHRAERTGLGAAYREGLLWGVTEGFDVLVQMDADGSHPPEVIPDLVDALADADVAIGSRYIAGGATVGWSFHRRMLSRGGNLYIRNLLELPLRDVTGGFRAYRGELLARMPLTELSSRGYCVQAELAWYAAQSKGSFTEIPIVFSERVWGRSKMNGDIIREALIEVTRWGISVRRGNRYRSRVARRVTADVAGEAV